MPQGPIPVQLNAQRPAGTTNPAQADAAGNLTISTLSGTQTKLYANGSTPFVLKAAPGSIVRANVLVAGSGTGTINDCATTAAIATANEVAVIPETVGPIAIEFPCLVGIAVQLGTGQVVSFAYQ
jgi:hypothetical protein